MVSSQLYSGSLLYMKLMKFFLQLRRHCIRRFVVRLSSEWSLCEIRCCYIEK